MTRRTWMPLYIPDFLADTVHLTADETGAYLLLIMDYWLHGGLPDDDAKLAKIARVNSRLWRRMKPTICVFFHDGWRHKRIDKELSKMILISTSRQQAGSKGGTIARWNDASKRQANVKQTLSKDPSKTEAVLNHTTQERNITSSFVGTAREVPPVDNSVSNFDALPDGFAEKAREAVQHNPGKSHLVDALNNKHGRRS